MENSPEKTGKVLIVDDEEIGRETLTGVLTPLNVRIACANGGVEALERCRSWKPDVVLLDVMMPEMDGFQVCRAIREDPEIAETPILLITALDDQDSRLEGFQSGADDFITKPIIRTELRMRIRSLLRINRYQHLLAAQTQFRWIADQSENGILLLDRNERITYVNPMARKLLELPEAVPADQLGDFRELVSGNFRLEPEPGWRMPLSAFGERCPRFLLKSETAVAPQFWLEVTPLELPLATDGGLAIRLTNITDRKIHQIAQWHFHSALNHKLRTPLSVIFGALELLESEGTGISPDLLRDLVALARNGATELKEKVDQALSFVNLTESVFEDSFFPNHGQSTLVREVATLMLLPPPNIHEAGPLSGRGIALSRTSMETIYLELFGNSVRFHPNHTPVIDISFATTDDRLDIRFADDGRTLSPDHLLKVWYPYFQGERWFTGQMKGMGVGLAEIALLVWGVGGTCEMTNRPGRPGVEVRLSLPLISPVSPARPETAN
jgi:CheY-like chemotaxis protein